MRRQHARRWKCHVSALKDELEAGRAPGLASAMSTRLRADVLDGAVSRHNTQWGVAARHDPETAQRAVQCVNVGHFRAAGPPYVLQL